MNVALLRCQVCPGEHDASQKLGNDPLLKTSVRPDLQTRPEHALSGCHWPWEAQSQPWTAFATSHWLVVVSAC